MLEIVRHHSSYSVSDKTRYFESTSLSRVEEVQWQMMAKRSHRKLKLICHYKEMRCRFDSPKYRERYNIYDAKVKALVNCKKYNSIDFLIK